MARSHSPRRRPGGRGASARGRRAPRARGELVADECRFRNVGEDYIKRRVSTQRRARATERVIRNVLIAHWGDKPIAEISRRDVVRLVEHIDGTGAPVYAQAAFAYGRPCSIGPSFAAVTTSSTARSTACGSVIWSVVARSRGNAR